MILKNKQNKNLYLFKAHLPISYIIQISKGMMTGTLKKKSGGGWEGTVRGLQLYQLYSFLSWVVDSWVFIIIMLYNLPTYYTGCFAWIKWVKKCKSKEREQKIPWILGRSSCAFVVTPRVQTSHLMADCSEFQLTAKNPWWSAASFPSCHGAT